MIGESDANMIILIAALDTSKENKTFYGTSPIRISLVYAEIVMLLYDFKSLLKKKKENQRLGSETLE